jgi:hypothetical protein
VKEANVQGACLVALAAAGCLVWRQNTGAYRLPDGRTIRYGLCVGSSDIVGIAPDGRFLAVEVKSERGRASEAQERFVAAVRAAGGRAGIARSAEEAVRIATE